MWDVHTYGNDFLVFTVWDVHAYGNDFLRFTVWDVHTYENDWVSMPRPIAHGPAWVPRGPIPDDLWVVWEGHPIGHTHLTMVPNVVVERGFKPFV